MIVDSSAIVAIVLREPGWEEVVARLSAEAAPAIGAPTLAEAGLMLTAKMGEKARIVLSRLLQETGLAIIPFAEDHWRTAVEAYSAIWKRPARRRAELWRLPHVCCGTAGRPARAVRGRRFLEDRSAVGLTWRIPRLPSAAVYLSGHVPPRSPRG